MSNSLVIDTKIDNSGVDKGLKDISSLVETGASKIKKALGGIGITKLTKDVIGLASDLEEVQNVVDVAFGSSADTINKFAKDAATSFGLSELSAKQFSGTMGAMLKSMGLTGDAVVNMSMDIVGLAGDMASFYNLDHQEAFDKIRSGIAGETEPLKQLGINMSVANLEAYALSQGIKTTYNEMSEAEKVTLRYNYLMSTTADAQGDFTRTQDSFANQLRIAKLEVQTAGAAIGKELLPVATQGAKVVGNLAKTVLPGVAKALKWVLDNSKTLLPIAAGLLTTYKGYKIFNDITKSLGNFVTKMSFKAAAMLADGTATAAATAANATFTAAMTGETVALNAGTLAAGAQTAAVSALAAAKAALLNPLGLAVVGIGALTAAMIAFVDTSDPELEAIQANTEAIKERTKAHQDLVQAQKENAESQLGEIALAQNLYDQLNELAGVDGTINEADVARAQVLANMLNPVLGETIQLNKDGTATLTAQKDAVYDLIAAKKAQIYLDAMMPAYQDALLKINAAYKEQGRILNEKKALDKEIADRQAQGLSITTEQAIRQKALNEELKNNTAELQGYQNSVLKGEEAIRLAAEGNTDALIELMDKEMVARGDSAAATLAMQAQSLIDSENYYAGLKDAAARGEEGISQEMLDAAAERVEQERASWDDVGTASMEAFISSFFKKQPDVEGAATDVAEGAVDAAGSVDFGVVGTTDAQDVAGGFSSMRENLKKVVAKGVGESKDSAASVDFWPTGLNGVTGLKNGWLSGIPDLRTVALQAANTVWSTIKSKWGIASPAKEFAKLARFGGDGLVVGFEEKIPEAEGAMEDVLDAMMDKARQVVAWRSGAVASNILTPITNYATAGAPTNLSATIQNNHTTQLTLDGRAIAESNNRQNQMLKLQYGMR